MDPFKHTKDDDERHKIRQRIFYLLALVLFMLTLSTVVYSRLEGWRFLDSLYFSTVTITTIGYGDLHPVTDQGKVFTIFFVLSGVAIMLYTLSTLGMYYLHYLDSHRPALHENIKNTVKKFSFNKQPDKWVDIYKIRKKP